LTARIRRRSSGTPSARACITQKIAWKVVRRENA
jgi:hypothetical protein